jgi:hypothetical protein
MECPTHYGFVRSRWTCETVVLLLRRDYCIRVGRETIQRCLRAADLVWRRLRPVLGPKEPSDPALAGAQSSPFGEPDGQTSIESLTETFVAALRGASRINSA